MSGRTCLIRSTLAALLLAWAVSPLLAQEPRVNQRTDQQMARQQGNRPLDVVRASRLMDAKVYNDENQHLGAVQNLAIDARHGQVAYAVLGSGGFLGLGEKEFAVPWQALRVRTDDRVVINADKQMLKDMRGFHGNEWPATADTSWLSRMQGQRGQYAQAGYAEGQQPTYNFKGSELIGMHVRNARGDDLGTVKDLMIDAHTGRIVYAVVSHGATLGMGGELVPVPFATLDTSQQDALRLDIAKQRFDTAPSFTNNDWTAVSDPGFASRVFAYYGQRPFWSQGQSHSERLGAPERMR